jgi:hypothetical protein
MSVCKIKEQFFGERTNHTKQLNAARNVSELFCQPQTSASVTFISAVLLSPPGIPDYISPQTAFTLKVKLFYVIFKFVLVDFRCHASNDRKTHYPQDCKSQAFCYTSNVIMAREAIIHHLLLLLRCKELTILPTSCVKCLEILGA